jgi:tetratricopeptide (TPR) repeat protein
MIPSDAETNSWRVLPQQIADAFSLEELRELCFRLDIRYEDLGENLGLPARATALVEHVERRGRSEALVAALRALRPTVEWPEPPSRAQQWVRQQRRWWVWAIALSGVLAVTAVFFLLRQPAPEPIKPMGSGFNIAVAQFTAFDAQGRENTTESSLAISQWLFSALENNRSRLPEALQVELRGPDDVGMVQGTHPEARENSAAEIADKHNAMVVIYGTVTGSENPYLLNIDYYVRDAAFAFGSEIAGPGRLGEPVAFNIPLTPASLTAVNAELNARALVLQYVVNGLSYLFIQRHDRARLEFTDALAVPRWTETEGHEVVYVLRGAAALEAYDPLTNPEPLAEAEADFTRARQLEPRYARAYLGLGAVALERAKGTDLAVCGTAEINPAPLVDAAGLYQTSLSATDRPTTAYVEAKAYYGLGQAHLLGWGAGVPEWSGTEAQRNFEAVLRLYEQADYPPTLLSLAAHAHAQLGLLAGHNEDWEGMVREVRRAIEMLEGLNQPTPDAWIARYWSWVGWAEMERGQTANGRRAYERALEIGGDRVQSCERQKWEEALGQAGG